VGDVHAVGATPPPLPAGRAPARGSGPEPDPPGLAGHTLQEGEGDHPRPHPPAPPQPLALPRHHPELLPPAPGPGGRGRLRRGLHGVRVGGYRAGAAPAPARRAVRVRARGAGLPLPRGGAGGGPPEAPAGGAGGGLLLAEARPLPQDRAVPGDRPRPPPPQVARLPDPPRHALHPVAPAARRGAGVAARPQRVLQPPPVGGLLRRRVPGPPGGPHVPDPGRPPSSPGGSPPEQGHTPPSSRSRAQTDPADAHGKRGVPHLPLSLRGGTGVRSAPPARERARNARETPPVVS